MGGERVRARTPSAVTASIPKRQRIPGRSVAAAVPARERVEPSVHHARLLDDPSRDEFLASVRREILRVAEEELRGTAWTAEGCPYIEYWFGYYGRRSAGEIEAAMRHYAGGVAATAADYLPLVSTRVRTAIRNWRDTGRIDAPAIPETPTALEARFGDARPLPSDVRTRMESGFGRDLSHIHVHSDGDGLARVGESTGSARALAVGQTIVFANNAFQPGTTIGDLLLAHEIAHTLQQARTSTASSAPAADEASADRLAVAAIARTRGIDVGMPALGAARGLSLRRCNPFTAKETEEAEADASTAMASTAPAITSPQRTASIPTLAPKAVRKNRDEDMFLVASGNEMVALPAKDLVYELLLKPTEISAQNIFGVPTVGKEGLRLVNIGGREALLIDSGGTPEALMPAAIRAIANALQITSLVGINTLHIHDDHIRNFEQFIIDNKIPPERLRFAQPFETPGKRFGRILARLRATTDARLVKLGYGKGAATPFSVWEVPEYGVFEKYALGDKRFEEYGIPAAFQKIGTPGKRSANDYDKASTILRIIDTESGAKVIVVGDPRGAALTDLRAALGEEAWAGIFEGVTVISGIQHHTGVLKDPLDRAGIEMLLVELLTRNPELTVIEQSTLRPTGGRGPQKPFLNASLIEALRQFGIGHEAALDPNANDSKSIGTITVDRNSNVQSSGDSISSSPGETTVAGRVRRFYDLGVAVETLRENAQLLTGPNGASIKSQIAELVAARESLGQALGLLPIASGQRNGLLQALILGVATGQDQARSALTNQADVDARKQTATTKLAAEGVFDDPTFAPFIAMLAREGALFRRAHAGLEAMRKTGVVSDELITDLILLDPELARRLLEGANVTADYRAKVDDEIKKAEIVAPTRMTKTASVMIALQLWNDVIGPAWGIHRMNEETVYHKYLNVIMWWQERGVLPNMEAADNYWLDDDTHTRNPDVIKQMIEQRMVDFLVLTKVEGEENWDRFSIWMSTHVKNFEDYVKLIRDKPAAWCPAVRQKSKEKLLSESSKWEYFAGDLDVGDVYSYSVDQKWLTDPRLDIIMSAMAKRVLSNTTSELGDAWKNRVALDVRSAASANVPGSYTSRPMLEDRAPTRHVRFKADASDRRAFQILKQSRAQGHLSVGDSWPVEDPTFYVLAPETAVSSADVNDIGSEYLLVVGADASTYEALTLVGRQVHEYEEGRLIRVKRNLNPTGQVLIKKNSVEDIP